MLDPPTGWGLKSLESLCVPNSPITYGVLKPGEHFPKGIPLLQIKDLGSGKVKLGNLHRISNNLDDSYKRSRVEKNDILISLVGTIGRLAIVPEELGPANIHRNIGRIRTLSIPTQAGHPYRLIPATHTDASRPPCKKVKM